MDEKVQERAKELYTEFYAYLVEYDYPPVAVLGLTAVTMFQWVCEKLAKLEDDLKNKADIQG